MIFVTVGTQKFQYNRLIEQVDLLCSKGIIKEKVVAQIGGSTYVPKNFPYRRYLDEKTFDKLIDRCDILITHSGVGTILKGLKHKKPIIVCPRHKKYDEHVDDHQVEIGVKFSEQGYTVLCNDITELDKALAQARQLPEQEFHVYFQNTAAYLENYIRKHEGLL